MSDLKKPITVYLPVEILDQIIRSTIPDLNYLAYPATHLATKTLLSFLTLSRATYRTAKILLYTHCLYIDKPWRLDTCLTKSLCQPDSCAPISCIQSLYLSPFSGLTIRERKVIRQITKLFTLLGPSLKRLVINMPLRSHYPPEDLTHKLRPILRKGFEQLIHLEEFSSVKDELYLAYWNPTFGDIPDPEVHIEHWMDDFMFERWTKLRRLALYNCVLDHAFRKSLQRMPMLEKLVLSRPDWDDDNPFWSGDAIRIPEAQVQITLVESTDITSEAGMRKLKFEGLPMNKQPNAWKYKLFVDKEDNPISSVQKWSLQCMLDGSLWSLPDLAEPDPELASLDGLPTVL